MMYLITSWDPNYPIPVCFGYAGFPTKVATSYRISFLYLEQKANHFTKCCNILWWLCYNVKLSLFDPETTTLMAKICPTWACRRVIPGNEKVQKIGIPLPPTKEFVPWPPRLWKFQFSFTHCFKFLGFWDPPNLPGIFNSFCRGCMDFFLELHNPLPTPTGRVHGFGMRNTKINILYLTLIPVPFPYLQHCGRLLIVQQTVWYLPSPGPGQ